jgi:hypothetical protein
MNMPEQPDQMPSHDEAGDFEVVDGVEIIPGGDGESPEQTSDQTTQAETVPSEEN